MPPDPTTILTSKRTDVSSSSSSGPFNFDLLEASGCACSCNHGDFPPGLVKTVKKSTLDEYIYADH